MKNLQADDLKKLFLHKNTNFNKVKFLHQKKLDLKKIPAAVLVPIINYNECLSVLFTQRTKHLTDHSGQISFPGGRVEKHDATIIDTALRECQEEIGLSQDKIEILGTMPKFETVTGRGYIVTPVVALINPPLNLNIDEREVAHVFEVNLDFLLQKQNQILHHRIYQQKRRYYYEIPYLNYKIWGVTAAILVQLRKLLFTLNNIL